MKAKQFYINIVLTIIIVVAVDTIISVIGDRFLRSMSKHDYVGQTASVSYSLNELKTDVLILGSSTASCQYYPKVFEECLDIHFSNDCKKVYNAGAANQTLSYDLAVLKSVVVRKKPQIVILDIQPTDLSLKTENYQIGAVKPYAGLNSNVDTMIKDNSSAIDYLKTYSGMYRLNTNFLNLLITTTRPEGADGFDVHTEEMNAYPEEVLDQDQHEVDSQSVTDFNKLIDVCKDSNIKLFLCISPALNHLYGDSPSYKLIQETATAKNIPLLDYNEDMSLHDYHNYRDWRHMNQKGAIQYSKMVCRDINETIK